MDTACAPHLQNEKFLPSVHGRKIDRTQKKNEKYHSEIPMFLWMFVFDSLLDDLVGPTVRILSCTGQHRHYQTFVRRIEDWPC